MTVLPVASRLQIEGLYRKHSAWLNSWVRRNSRSMSSEDVASEVFLRLCSLNNIGELREPRAMMATIARRVIYDLRNRNVAWRACEAELMALPETLATSPEEHAIVIEALRAIDKMLETLTPKARAAFLFYKVGGMKQEAVAKELGVSVPTVERYIAQGVRRAVAMQLGML